MRLNHLECADGALANGAKLSDLSVDCQSEIVNKIDIHGLIGMATKNTNYQTLAADIFNQKFANKRLRVTKWDDSYMLGVDDWKKDRKFDINSLYVLLEAFGEHISNIHIHFDTSDESDSNLKKFIELTNQYCKNLSEFSTSGGKDPLSDVKTPFYNVTSINFAFTKFETHQLNLNEIFPNMQKLHLNFDEMSKTLIDKIIDDHFPKLNYLEYSYVLCNDRAIRKLIKKNPQIRTLEGFLIKSEICQQSLTKS